ncbi:uncharacterized protein CMU_026770 [Cryptosporidium muris RN66]|uniref:Uncharacterized protein n=1 Tax=Cryptosporidium muris (strain RN66) TaxID=441375 RepID=B6ABB7_CRYMR|nr:uncharacterized protein CMU_026770 [Cryptosporidium muris RN66]EEA05669.1 hypothetical protein CMU_026770 [Cryptosporidium muris RN66]|eukprot:XP_002140018.1 hypothetical protein [Cryptosporidium muris RN66]
MNRFLNLLKSKSSAIRSFLFALYNSNIYGMTSKIYDQNYFENDYKIQEIGSFLVVDLRGSSRIENSSEDYENANLEKQNENYFIGAIALPHCISEDLKFDKEPSIEYRLDDTGSIFVRQKEFLDKENCIRTSKICTLQENIIDDNSFKVKKIGIQDTDDEYELNSNCFSNISTLKITQTTTDDLFYIPQSHNINIEENILLDNDFTKADVYLLLRLKTKQLVKLQEQLNRDIEILRLDRADDKISCTITERRAIKYPAHFYFVKQRIDNTKEIIENIRKDIEILRSNNSETKF